jgi:hypothetical protein
VLRSWESLDRGDAPEAIVWHAETALLLAAILPLVSREMLFHLSDEEEADGFPITAVYGEQGPQVAGWLRRFEPGLVGALHLAEALARNPPALAAVLQASGDGAGRLHSCPRRRVVGERLFPGGGLPAAPLWASTYRSPMRVKPPCGPR